MSFESQAQFCIFVGSLAAVYRESTKILCSVQNDFSSKACTKVLRDLNFVHTRVAGKPCTRIEIEMHFCTMLKLVFDHFVHPEIRPLREMRQPGNRLQDQYQTRDDWSILQVWLLYLFSDTGFINQHKISACIEIIALFLYQSVVWKSAAISKVSNFFASIESILYLLSSKILYEQFCLCFHINK